jgi:hypothetical protein
VQLGRVRDGNVGTLAGLIKERQRGLSGEPAFAGLDLEMGVS